ncbi:MAG: hypothetical protein ACREEB_14600 [Caulobacteraceae bacterium]
MTASPPDDVFINCPFDDAYARTFEALIFAVTACGFRARSARELDDGGQTRFEKLCEIIAECRYGIHDLSRTELDAVSGLPRFNMPLELGIFLGAKRLGDATQRLKRCLILDVAAFRYQQFASDLAGMDIHDHGGDARRAVVHARDWLRNATRRKTIPGPIPLLSLYDRFMAEKPAIAAELGFDPSQIPYLDYESMVTDWLLRTLAP